MAKPISFKDVNPEPPWEIEQQVREQELREEAHLQESAGLPEEKDPENDAERTLLKKAKEEAMAEVMDDMGLSEDYLTQTVELSFEQRAGQPVVKPKRFGNDSTAEGPDEVNL